MLYQEENQTVRPLLGLASMRVMVVVLRRLLDEVMHKVGARYGQEGKERQHSTERAETAQALAPVPPPLPAICTTMEIYWYDMHRQAHLSLSISTRRMANSSMLLANQQGYVDRIMMIQ